MFQTKVVGRIRMHILCPITFFLNHAINEIMWINVLEWDRPQMTIWHMCIACWIPRATNKHSGCVILADYPLQQCGCPLCLNVSLYIHCLSGLFLCTSSVGFCIHCLQRTAVFRNLKLIM